MSMTHRMHEEIRNTYKVLVENSEGNRPLGRPRHRQNNNIKINPRRTWCVYILESTDSQKDPMPGSCELGNKPTGSTGSREFLDQLSNYQILKKDSTALT